MRDFHLVTNDEENCHPQQFLHAMAIGHAGPVLGLTPIFIIVMTGDIYIYIYIYIYKLFELLCSLSSYNKFLYYGWFPVQVQVPALVSTCFCSCSLHCMHLMTLICLPPAQSLQYVEVESFLEQRLQLKNLEW